MKLSIIDLERALGISPINVKDDLLVSGISIDSRDIKENDLFVAIKGNHFNGHDYIDDAFKNGASVAISEKYIHTQPTFVVDNTIKSLGKIANYFSSLIQPISIGITGTNGKTTVTNLTANILKQNNKIFSIKLFI